MRHPQPPNEDAFEEFCLVLLRRHWNCPSLERFGHRGEPQHGVDLVDLSGGDPLRAAQCKHHASDKTLPPSEFRAEVEKAKGFRPALGYYAVLTTAKKSAETQKEVIVVNKEQREQGLFQVELLTWEGIERLFDEYPDIQDRLVTMPASVVKDQFALFGQQARADIIETFRDVSGPSSSDARDADIDEAKACLERNEFQVARLLLNRIRRRHWDTLTGRQRYRVTVNTAAAVMGEAQFPEAGRLFVEAASYQPDDLEAQALEAVGYELLGEARTAYERAGSVLTRNPTTAKAAGVRVRTAPSDISLEQLGREIDPSAIDAEVAVALAIRGMKDAAFERAKELAQRATQGSPDWPPAWLVLGQVHFARVTEELRKGRTPVGPPDHNVLTEAERCLTRAIELARAQGGSHPSLVDALVTRSRTRALLIEDGGHADLEEAHRLAPDDPEILVNYAARLNDHGKTEEALDCARRAVTLGNSADAKFMLGVFQWRANRGTSRKDATNVFRELALQPELTFQPEAAAYAMRGFCEFGEWADAETLVSDVVRTGDKVMSAVLAGTLAQARGDLASARQHAQQASCALTPETRTSTVRFVASLLGLLGLHGDALPLWQRIFLPVPNSPDAHNLVACAQRLGRFDVALAACRSLREHGASSREIFEQEAGLLERFDPPEAIKLLQEYLAKDPEDRLARLRLSVIGLRIGRPDLVGATEADLPRVEEVEAVRIPYVVGVLREAGNQDAALTYAYRALRRNYGAYEAHQAYLSVLAPGNQRGPAPSRPTVVTAGTAVCFAEEGSTESRWIVVEDDVDCHALLNERRADDPLVSRFIGKAVGDSVVLADSPIQARKAKITEIVDKHVYRIRDVWDGWELRFPDHPNVQAIRLPPTSGEVDGKLDLAPIFKAVDLQHARTAEVLKAHREHVIPVHAVAKALNQSVVTAALALAEHAESEIRVGARSPMEIADVLGSLQAGATLVADPSAIATMLLLDLEAIFSAITPVVLVSASVNDDCKQAAREMTRQAGTGTMFQVPGGHAFHEITPEESRASRKLEEQLSELRRHVELIGCPSLAAVPPERRKDLEQMFGDAGAESMVNSSIPGRVLWTDDLAEAVIAGRWFGARTISTELVLRSLAERGVIERAQYFAACASLITWKYVPTPVNAEILVEAARRSGWNAGKVPLTAILDLFGLDAFPSEGVVAIACAALAKLFAEIDLPETRNAILTSMLDRVARRKDWKATTGRIGVGLSATFGLNVVRCAEAEQGITAWLAHHSSSAGMK